MHVARSSIPTTHRAGKKSALSPCMAEPILKSVYGRKAVPAVSNNEIQYLKGLAEKRNPAPKIHKSHASKEPLKEKADLPGKTRSRVLDIHIRAIKAAEHLEGELKQAVNGDSEPIKRKLKRISGVKRLAERILVADLEAQYLQALAPTGKVLTRQEEYCVFRIYSRAIAYIGKLEEKLGSDAETKVMEYGRLGGAKKLSETAVVSAQSGLLWRNAKKIPHPPSILLEDVVQEGRKAIIENAMPKFDIRLGNRFSTYGMWWARQAMRRMIQDCGKDIRRPVHLYDAANRIGKASRRFFNETGAEPSAEEVAEMTGLNVKAVRNIMTLPETVSMNKKRNLGEDPEVMEVLSDRTVASPEDALLQGEMKEVTARLLSTLTPQEAYVVRKRFGIGFETEASFKEISDERHVTRERGRQIFNKFMDKLRKKGKGLLREGYQPPFLQG